MSLSTVQQQILSPTGDAVSYDSAGVSYPASNVVDTFGTVWASRLFGQALSAVELGSSGKIAFTPSNEHSLDLQLDRAAGAVELRSRAGAAFHATNEGRSAWLTLGDGGDSKISGSGASVGVDATGARIDAPSQAARHAVSVAGVDVLTVGASGASVSNLEVSGTVVLVTSGSERMRYSSGGQIGYGTQTPRYDMDWIGDFHIEDSGGSSRFDLGASGVEIASSGSVVVECGHEVARFESSGASVCNLVVTGSNLTVPRGTTSLRPAGYEGQVFYNYDTSRFEGFAGGAWGGLGGVIDVDQNTYVKAEDSPGANDNRLRFVTDGTQRMVITETGRLGYGTSAPQYTVDVVGDLRVSGNLLAGTTRFGNNGLTMLLAVQPDGSTVYEDGDKNDGAGIMVAGLPLVTVAASKNVGRFEKSLRWHKGGAGMSALGKSHGWADESYWKMRGGAFHLSHTNVDSGAEVEYILRIDSDDQLQLVRHVSPTDGGSSTFDVVARFGSKAGKKYSSGVGIVEIDAERTTLDASAGTVNAFIESSCAFSGYSVSGALFPTSATPGEADVAAAVAAGFGWSASSLTPGVDNVSNHLFSSMHDGSPIPDTVLKFVGVVSTPSLGSSAHISFVINSPTFFDDIMSTAQTTSTITFKIRFSGFSWNSLSAADQAAFTSWMNNQLVQGVVSKGINVTSITASFSQGSILATVVLTYYTKYSKSLLDNIYKSGPSDLIGTLPENGTVNLPDSGPMPISPSNVSAEVVNVTVNNTSPSVQSAIESIGNTSPVSMYIDFAVQELNKSYHITTLHVLVSPVQLASPVLSATVAGHPDSQHFGVINNTGTVCVAMDTSKLAYIYIVAQNNAPSPVLSPPFSMVNQPLVIPSTPIGVIGNAIARQSGNFIVTNEFYLTFTTQESGTAHLFLFRSGDPIPGYEALIAMLPPGAASASLIKSTVA